MFMTEGTKVCPQCGSVNALSTLVCTRCKKVLKMQPKSSYWTYGLKPIDRETESDIETEGEFETDSATDEDFFEVTPNRTHQVRKHRSSSLRVPIVVATAVIVLWIWLAWIILMRPI
jgi:hypothetical protein